MVVRLLTGQVSPKRTPFQTGTNRWPHLWTVPGKRWISHTHPMWLWGHSLFKISSPGPVVYGTKWLLWRLHKQSLTFHRKCRIDKGFPNKGKHNISLKVAVKWPEWSTPHSFIHWGLKYIYLLFSFRTFTPSTVYGIVKSGPIKICPTFWEKQQSKTSRPSYHSREEYRVTGSVPRLKCLK
jgi:hypothetical protein